MQWGHMGVQAQLHVDALECICIGMQACWRVDVLSCGHDCMWMCWHAGAWHVHADMVNSCGSV